MDQRRLEVFKFVSDFVLHSIVFPANYRRIVSSTEQLVLRFDQAQTRYVFAVGLELLYLGQIYIAFEDSLLIVDSVESK